MKTRPLFLLLGLFLTEALHPSIATASGDFVPRPAPATIGITGGYNRTFHSGFTDGPFTATPGTKSGDGFHAGLAFERELPFRFVQGTQRTYLHINLTFDRSPAALERAATTIDPFFVVNARGHVPVERTTSVTHDMVKLDLLLRQMVLPTDWANLSGFSISAGPTFGWLLKGRTRETMVITDPDPSLEFTYGYTNANKRESIRSNTPIDGARRVRFGVKGAISYERTVLRDIIVLSPTISYDHALASQSDKGDWRANTLQLSLDARCDLPRLWKRLTGEGETEDANPL